MNLKNVCGWIFDNDGLLQDTEPDYEWSFCDIAQTFNRPKPGRELLLRVKGLDLREVARLMITELGLPLSGYDEFKRELDVRLMQRAPDAVMMSGATELVQFLRKRGVPCAVATSATTEILERKTRHHFSVVYSSFAAMVAGDDPAVKKGKPAPDLLLVSAERIGIPPSYCAYVGDNPVDVQAAIAAGILPIAVPGAGKSPSEFSEAAYIFSDLKMLLSELKS